MKLSFVAFVAAMMVATPTSSNALELTPDNWDAETAGKTVLLKFYAPWCGHCKKMKPDYEKLMADFEGSATQLVAEVDCTTEGKPLCDANGVRGFPTLKWGDPAALEDYQGGRDYDSMKKFADENLKPICSPSNIELCDDEKKAEIAKFQAMGVEALDTLISEKEEEQAKLETDFKEFVEGLQKQYQEAMETKEKGLDEITKSGLGLMKAVKASLAGGDSSSSEL
mmetsp:Transcript_55516/g.84030  ORF Transcript_55516/g.84030 Transcript_55516/m.84030 type:complete len:225 (+) Transcript_55516:129-803(+)|eukprot:CAMPEP_0117022350 /NCGR_PEP_ID=MMETSP0472-20121206/16803_1 /TAXON_ID=693140 ORGANISM="Tiarina fusus, Strain LIS" /NCGR_SAMPLE_ID=MMETSP0472 /ASSEMBLY_ACC=CAM_ASM_000603 /LENGTH=224 /DNA_ID=CAMNT_0004728177 /DNA_START=126 /DNA_END=800 /DNA_ORIENTATION=-